MASKVNTKFVVILGTGLLVLFIGVAVLAVKASKKSGEDLVKLGDQAMAEDKLVEASDFYAKAVNKNQRNAEWIKKWMAAMTKSAPADRTKYIDTYSKQYLSALEVLPLASPEDLTAHRNLLQERLEWVRNTPNSPLGAWESLGNTVDDAIKNFAGSPTDAKILRRYRGLVKLGILGINQDMKEDDVKSAQQDFTEALAADPSDGESVDALAVIDRVLADRARKADNKARYNELMTSARERLDKFIKEHPPAASSRLVRFNIDRIMLIQKAQDEGRAVTAAEILQDRQQQLRDIMAAILAEKPEKLSQPLVAEGCYLAQLGLGVEARELVTNAITHAMKNPDEEVALQFDLARAEASFGDREQAIATLQKVVERPNPPLSSRGVRLFGQRDLAVAQQLDLVFSMWELEQAPEKREALALRAQKLRDNFATRVGDSDPAILNMDARLALIKGDYNGSRTILQRYLEQTGEKDTQSMTLLGTILMRQGNVGAAKQKFERVLQLQPNNLRAMISLCDIETSAGNFSQALAYITVAAKLTPSDGAITRQRKALEDLVNNKTDPAMNVLRDAQAKASGLTPDLAAAEKILREGIAANKSEMLYRALVQLLGPQNRKDEVLAVIDDAIKQFPSNKANWEKLKIDAFPADVVAARLEGIDKSSASEVQKHLYRHDIFKGDGQQAKAEAELEAARKLAPEDPQVNEYLFAKAYAEKNPTELDRIAKLAEEKNLDQVGGLLYKARLQIFNKDVKLAAETLQSALERDKLNHQAWRLLGQLYAELDPPQYQKAADAFSKAIEIRPYEVSTITFYLRMLMASGNTSEALVQARRLEANGGSDPDFVNIFTAIETNAPGGDKAKAQRIREQVAKSRPDDLTNIIELINLQMDQRQWDAARTSIETLKANPDTKADAIASEARWYALQNKNAEAEKLWADFIAELPKDKVNEDLYIYASRQFSGLGQHDRAVAMLERGRPLQTPETMKIDREIGDVLFNARKVPDAIEAYKRVLTAGSPDKDGAVAKRILEGYLNLKDYGKFDEMMTSLGQRAQEDSTLLILGASAAEAQGNPEAAQSLYDKAVAVDAKNWLVFLKRGQYNAKNPAKSRDAEQDYAQAARLNPGSPIPLVQLGAIYQSSGKLEQADEQFTKALIIEPNNDNLRNELINLKIAQQKPEFVPALIDDAIKARPDSVGWLLRGGAVMSDLGKTDQAVDYLSRAWTKKPELAVAIPYVTALLGKTPPDLQTAQKIVNSKELEVVDEMPRRVLRAMVLHRAGRTADVDRELQLGFEKLDQNNPQQTSLFMSGLESVFLETKPRLEALDRLEAKSAFTSWMLVQAEAARLAEPARADKSADNLIAFADKSQDASLKSRIFRLVGGHFYQKNQFQRSVDAFSKGLALNQDDAELHNNIAYIQAVKLKQPSDAMVHAQRASDLAPESAVVLDTLGTVHLELKNYDKALATLNTALAKSASDNERAPIHIHMGRAFAGQKSFQQARQSLDAAQTIMRNNPQLDAQYGKDLKDAQEQLDAK